jgi:sugar phosphate isomerase/epimerase
VDQLTRFREAGFTHTEIYIDMPLTDPDEGKYIVDYAGLAKKNYIGFYSVHVPYNKVDVSVMDPVARLSAVDATKKTIELLAGAGNVYFVIHPGSLVGNDAKEARIDNSVESLTALAGFVRGTTARLAVENMLPSHVGEGAVELASIIARLPGDVGVCLDSGHAFITDGSPAKALKVLGDRLFTLHVHDNDGKSDLHQMPGEGGIDWKEYINGLVGAGFQGVFMLETGGKRDTADVLKYTGEFCRKNLPV